MILSRVENAKKAARALDGVNGAEDAGQQRRILGVLFEFDEFLIQAREVLMTLDKELTNHFLILHALVLHGPHNGLRRYLSAPAPCFFSTLSRSHGGKAAIEQPS